MTEKQKTWVQVQLAGHPETQVFVNLANVAYVTVDDKNVVLTFVGHEEIRQSITFEAWNNLRGFLDLEPAR